MQTAPDIYQGEPRTCTLAPRLVKPLRLIDTESSKKRTDIIHSSIKRPNEDLLRVRVRARVCVFVQKSLFWDIGSRVLPFNKSAAQFFMVVGWSTLTSSILGHLAFVRSNCGWQRRPQHTPTIPARVKPSLDCIYVSVIVYFQMIPMDHWRLLVEYWTPGIIKTWLMQHQNTHRQIFKKENEWHFYS